jgi:uncharacterized protein (TIGR00251 family)
VVTVRVRPRSRPSIDWDGDVVVIGVAAPPVKGQATHEARRALARAFGVSASSVELVSGARSRTKTFRIWGLTSAQIVQRLHSIIGAG